ncbi:hypothetical protein CEXT_108431 [Caerostris extrusa]|uniref:Uncharacterized protein n=1 Tax=Caerostris extrusa TaxID=172846 RepID=A0AAV4SYG4_CAEEX|nr:hypothetical protein CEXT_108431 [Caerostris extrusa]
MATKRGLRQNGLTPESRPCASFIDRLGSEGPALPQFDSLPLQWWFQSVNVFFRIMRRNVLWEDSGLTALYLEVILRNAELPSSNLSANASPNFHRVESFFKAVAAIKCPHLDTSPVVSSQPTLYGFTPGSPAEIIRVKGPGAVGGGWRIVRIGYISFLRSVGVDKAPINQPWRSSFRFPDDGVTQ